MKQFIIVPVLLILQAISCFAQKNALNIPGIHQLVSYSKSENSRQNEAKEKQAVTLANEGVNKTQLAKLKNVYRTIQQRYSIIGTAIDAANIGLQASPMVSRIVTNQEELYQLASKNPALVALAYQTEIEFGQKAYSLINYLVGLCASIGDINQMKAGDRRMLFDFIILELSHIQNLSGKLVNAIRYSDLNSLIRAANPFQGYIDQDVSIVNEIIQNAKYLKR
jgi:hypothetical protein